MNDANFTACKDSAFIVPYMYGELSSSDCASFESHLLDCGECTDQFADISNARYEVYEWKKLEFEPLSTPKIKIAYAQVHSADGYSWFEKVRAALAHGWSAPGFAFAGMAIVATFAVLMVTTRDTDNGNVASANVNVQVESNSATIPSPVTKKVVADDRALDPVGPTRIKAEPAGRNEAKRVNQTRKTPRRQMAETRSTSAQNLPRSAPSLNEFAEDEDTSLRLAELFDDIETSD